MSEYAEYADLWRQTGRPLAEPGPDDELASSWDEAVPKLRALIRTRPDVGEEHYCHLPAFASTSQWL